MNPALQKQDTDLARREAEDRAIDYLEIAIVKELEAVDLPLKHQFVPGMYIRTIFMPAGTLLTSKIHKTEHPFVVTKGVAIVRLPGGEVERLKAGHIGITKPYTRRTLYIEEDCTWTTFHITDSTDLTEIEEELIERRELPDGSTTHDLYLEALTKMPGQLDYGGAP